MDFRLSEEQEMFRKSVRDTSTADENLLGQPDQAWKMLLTPNNERVTRAPRSSRPRSVTS